MISLTHLFFYFYGICSGGIIGMDWGLLILTIFNPPKANQVLIATQLGQQVCLLAILIGCIFGVLLGSIISMLMIEIIDLFSVPFQICLYLGIITGFGTPAMIQSFTILNFFYYLIRILWNKENCGHIIKCECETINASSNNLIEDIYLYNKDSQFWNPLVIFQMMLPGNFFGVVIGGIYQLVYK